MRERKKPKEIKEEKEKEISAESLGVVLEKKEESFESWNPKTGLGNKVKNKEITDIKEILDKGLKIMEVEVVDFLMPNLESDLLNVGQSKGKFGGGKRSIWKQTQKKTKEGNKPKFSALAVLGNKAGYIGLGYGNAKETLPAREKAIRLAKLSLFNVKLGCGSWACDCKENHSIPIATEGKCGSVRIKLIPAPRGTGLKVEKELQKILSFAGIKDIYSQTYGHTKTKLNLIYACKNALENLNKIKIRE